MLSQIEDVARVQPQFPSVVGQYSHGRDLHLLVRENLESLYAGAGPRTRRKLHVTELSRN